jgi:hypothetical protein
MIWLSWVRVSVLRGTITWLLASYVSIKGSGDYIALRSCQPRSPSSDSIVDLNVTGG